MDKFNFVEIIFYWPMNETYKAFLILLDHFFIFIIEITRIATFIKGKLKKSDDETNIDKYRVAANIT